MIYNLPSLPILNLGNSRLPFKWSMILLILVPNNQKKRIMSQAYISLGVSMPSCTDNPI